MHLIAKLEQEKKISPPRWLAGNVLYATLMGSHAYNCATSESDYDVYGTVIPPKDILFRRDEIPDFDINVEKFQQFQASHIIHDGKEYDITLYSLPRYFRLLANANPNLLDSIYTPRTAVIHSTQVSELIRQKRKVFLSKKSYHTCKAYAMSQLHKMSTKETTENSKRMEIKKKFGFDLKFATHLVRLLLECDQILRTGDIDMTANSEILKSIRRGEWTEEKIREWSSQQEKSLDRLYTESNEVPFAPDEKAIRRLLIECIELFYSSVKDVFVDEDENTKILREIKLLVNKSNL